MVHGLEGEYWGRVDFIYIDRQGEGNASVTDRFGITGQPVIVLLDAEGSEVQRFFGFVQEADLRAALDGLLG
jgi:thioredoxin-like negative regulator of GroEL